MYPSLVQEPEDSPGDGDVNDEDDLLIFDLGPGVITFTATVLYLSIKIIHILNVLNIHVVSHILPPAAASFLPF